MRRSALAIALILSPFAALAAPDQPAPDHPGRWWTNSQGCEYVRSSGSDASAWHLISRDTAHNCPNQITTPKVRGLRIEKSPRT